MARMKEFKQLFYDYFNPVGRLHFQIQIICRVIVCGVFLDDLFDVPELECDTSQVGCTAMCTNRFAPVNHKRIWEMELFMILCCIAVFTVFHFANQSMYRQKKHPEKLRFKTKEKWGKDTTEPRTVIESRITRCGYMVMLCVRLCSEVIFLWLENQLGQHQSQNVSFWDRFWLKEQWVCATNNLDAASQDSLDNLVPIANRSTAFWTDDLNLACIQQKVTVTCWIPFSRMKSYGLWFMYVTLVISTILTVLELAYEFVYHQCCKSSRPKKADDIEAKTQLYPSADTMKAM